MIGVDDVGLMDAKKQVLSLQPALAPADRASFAWRLRAFDHLVGVRDERRRYVKAECVGSLEVEHQFELGRLLDRQIARRRPFKNLVDKVGRAATQLDEIHPIGQQAAGRRGGLPGASNPGRTP